MILPKYMNTNKTCVILPKKQMNYQAIIIEEKELFHVNKTPLEIIKESCSHYWASYEGRRGSVIHHLAYKQKTSIPVSVDHKLCFFPTQAPTHMDTCWVNWLQVDRWSKINKKDRRENVQTEVIFKNGYRLELDVSAHTLKQQMDRAFVVIYESGMIDER